MRIYSDVAIDDFSLSPECFGLSIPTEHLQGYNYYDQRILQDKTPHEDFVNRTSKLMMMKCYTVIERERKLKKNQKTLFKVLATFEL